MDSRNGGLVDSTFDSFQVDVEFAKIRMSDFLVTFLLQEIALRR